MDAKIVVKILGLTITSAGVVLSLLNLKGFLKYPERLNFAHLALETSEGIPLSHPGAKSFMSRFPPPPTDSKGTFTHFVKNAIQFTGGGTPLSGTVKYMYPDGRRTAAVATFEDVKRWAAESRYPWLAWWLTVVGLLITSAGVFWDWRTADPTGPG
ncbi:MAG: hypothetical protein HY597_05725 [Candidatus Omnitrophica bacterium]|nr:hypothetical protein [Candidatus Omnitrophota bacterium]